MNPDRQPIWSDALEAVLGLLALALFSVAGDLVRSWLHLPVPGMVVGLLLLLVSLMIVGRVPAGLRRAADLLIRHMNLFFIPAAVAVAAYVRLLREDAWPIGASLVLGTWAALAVAALTFRAVASDPGDSGR
ncbi:MAG: CidA/LrgA family protein [Polyangiaceae bacterium]